MFGANYMTPDQYNQMLMQGMNRGNYNNPYAMQNYNTYNNMQQSQMQNTTTATILKGRPVAGIEEARASMIDLDGSTFIFPDVANKMIYTKQINLNGEPEFKTYKLVEDAKPSQPEQNNPDYVLASDFEDIVSKLIKRIKRLEGKEDVTILPADGKTANAK